MLILSGELAQGLADAEFDVAGVDDETPLQRRCMALALAVARLALAQTQAFPERELAELEAATLPAQVMCRSPEGYAFYAVDPMDYARAARRIAASAPLLVIGLRSIGASLAAAVAAAVDAPTPVTVRPHGPPFGRMLRVSPPLRARLAAHPGCFAIVDEGPGLSGSSFAAAAALLMQLGVPPARIVFMPSHAAGPGRAASAEVQRIWQAVRVAPAASDARLSADAVAARFTDVTGPVRSTADLSGGAWRNELPPHGRPPAWPAQERRKFRLAGPDGVFLARFAGLGRIGAAKLELARKLHRAGFAPEPLALRGGFLLERWVAGPRLAPQGPDRRAFLSQLARYLAFRAALTCREGAGASAAALRDMALANAEEAGGAELRAALASRLCGLEAILSPLVPVKIDGRLHAWEWRREAAGAWIKTDGLDHAEAHDLVGCQSIAWDLAGAEVEFGLSPAEAARLATAIGSLAPAPPAVAVCALLYCAFQLGWWSFAAEAQAGTEAEGAWKRRAFYVRELEGRLGR
jgi:hypothetical protein